MPFKSKQQSRFMHKFHPDIAERWKKETKKKTGSRKLPKGTPKKVRKKTSSRKRKKK